MKNHAPSAPADHARRRPRSPPIGSPINQHSKKSWRNQAEALPLGNNPTPPPPGQRAPHTRTYRQTLKHCAAAFPPQGKKKVTPEKQKNIEEQNKITFGTGLGSPPPPPPPVFLRLGGYAPLDSSSFRTSVPVVVPGSSPLRPVLSSPPALEILLRPFRSSSTPAAASHPGPYCCCILQGSPTSRHVTSRAGEVEGPFFCRLGEGLLVLRELPRDVCLQRVVRVRLLQHLRKIRGGGDGRVV